MRQKKFIKSFINQFNKFNLERGGLLCNNKTKIYQKIYLYDDDDFADPFDDNDTDGWEY